MLLPFNIEPDTIYYVGFYSYLAREKFPNMPNIDQIYLDNAASTPVDPRVLDTYVLVSQKCWGNPSNTRHSYGQTAKNLLEEARERAGRALGVDPKGIIFTSGATEANNIVLKGASCLYSGQCSAVISSIEHACINESSKSLAKQGIPIRRVPVNGQGTINLEELYKMMKLKNHRFKFYDIKSGTRFFASKKIRKCIECGEDNFADDYLGSDEKKISNIWLDIESYSKSTKYPTENSEEL